MENAFIAFITNNHIGIVNELSLLLYYLKISGNVMVRSAATIEVAYMFLMIEFSKRQARSGHATTTVLPKKEVFKTCPVLKIGNSPAPTKNRYFAVVNDDYAGIMTSPETVMDSLYFLAGDAYVAEADSAEIANRIIDEYSCCKIRWKGAYFTSETFPVLPIAIELDNLYQLGYTEFLAKETGVPGWMNNGNAAVINGTELMLEGGGNHGGNG